MTLDAFAIDAELALREGTDLRAPGGEVTVALCGHWEHEGPCRWPHNSRVDSDTSPAHLRTVIVVPAEERAEAVSKIETQLRNDDRWSVSSFGTGSITPEEQPLAARLARAKSP